MGGSRGIRTSPSIPDFEEIAKYFIVALLLGIPGPPSFRISGSTHVPGSSPASFGPITAFNAQQCSRHFITGADDL